MNHTPIYLCALGLTGCFSTEPADFDVDAQIDYCHQKVLKSIENLGDDYTCHPRSIRGRRHPLGDQSEHSQRVVLWLLAWHSVV